MPNDSNFAARGSCNIFFEGKVALILSEVLICDISLFIKRKSHLNESAIFGHGFHFNFLMATTLVVFGA